ncbi:MAG: hypothetical protein KDA21_02105, partial [Phycisphaerales bacterium]|nr:hypothetical protein [Phycisphaerales bacterium]
MMSTAVSRHALIATVALLLTLAPAAHAQRVTTPEVRRGDVVALGREVPYDQLLSQQAADHMARAINRRLREMADPGRVDYALVAAAYAVVAGIEPLDEELARRELEAWTLADDAPGIDRALNRLVQLAPDDTVAQLRLINRRIRRLQDADARLDGYALLLGPRGETLDPSIRSRLALDAALLLRETGDEVGFLNHLNLALALDVSNKDAAVLFASWVSDHTDDPRERLEVLLNITLADPLDREAWLNAAFELMENGAFRGAARMLDIAATLTLAEGQVLDVATLFDVLLTTWNSEGNAACIAKIDDLISTERRRDEARRAAIIAEGLDPGPERDIRLPPNIELLNLAVHLLEKDEARVAATVERVQSYYGDRLEAIGDPTAWPEGFTEADAEKARAESVLELTWILVLAGRPSEEIDPLLADLAALSEKGLVDTGAIERTRGWLAGRHGNIEEARVRLSPLVRTDSSARLALAMSEEMAGNTDAATRHYARLALDQPNSIVGSFSRHKVEQIIGKPVTAGPHAAALDDYAVNFAPWVERFLEDPHAFMAVKVEQVRPNTDLLGRSELRFVLRNVSRRTLAVGVAAPIKSRFLLAPQLKIGGYDYMGLDRPEILRIDRRLRLSPGEELDLTMWSTRGALGFALETTPDLNASLRWRVVQGFEFNQDGGYDPGP